MPELRFIQVDVFTDHIFGGNALAVFLDGRSVPEEVMLPLAREMNLSETTFVLPADDSADVAHVRIFTPGQELPFAGHPTIGTSYVLATEGLVQQSDFTLQEAIGRIPVRIEGDLTQPGLIWMTQPLPTFTDPVLNRAEVASRIGLSESDLLDIPARIGSAGVPFLFIGVKDPERVDAVSLSDRDLTALGNGNGQGVFVFAPIPGRTNEVHSRMLGSHGLGIVEDPATGGASGPLGAFLLQEGVFERSATVDLLSRQGYAMGRPSDIHIRLHSENGSLTKVEVGGHVAPVGEGVIRLP